MLLVVQSTQVGCLVLNVSYSCNKIHGFIVCCQCVADVGCFYSVSRLNFIWNRRQEVMKTLPN